MTVGWHSETNKMNQIYALTYSIQVGNVFSFVSGGDSTLICFVPHKDVKTVGDNFDTFVNLPRWRDIV